MTVNVTTDRTGPLIAASAAPLPFTFQALSAAEIEVYLDDVLVNPNAYTVVLNGDGTGSVVPLAPWAGKVYILSAPSFQQPFTFNRFVPLYPDQIVPPLDRLAKTVIALRNRLSRGLPQIGNIITGAAGGAAAIVTRLVGGQTYWDITLPTGVQGPAGDVARMASRTAMAAIVGQTAGLTRYLSETGREGTFIFNAANLSAKVTADTAQGIYVAPASDPTGASGAWVRKFNGPRLLTPEMFGAVGDGVTDDYTALQAWLDAGGRLALNAKQYYSSQRLQVRRNVHVQGATYGFNALVAGYSNMPGSRIRFAAGQGGIIAWGQTTHDVTSAVVGNPGLYFTQEGARYSTFRDFALIGANVGAAVTGFESRTRVFLENVHCIQFEGKGFDIQGSADINDVSSNYGNPSLSTLKSCRAEENGSHGFHIRGRDASVVGLYDCDAVTNGGWGIWDQSLVGGHYDNCHIASNVLGSIKATQIIGSIAFVNVYVEGAFRSNCDIAANHFISGGTLSGVVNDASSGGLPTAINGLTARFNYLRVNGNAINVGAVVGEGVFQRHPTHGAWLQGEGSTYDFTLRNKGNLDVMNVPTGTQDALFAGNISSSATGYIKAGSLGIRRADNNNLITGAAGAATLFYAVGTGTYQLLAGDNIAVQIDVSAAGNVTIRGTAQATAFKVGANQVVGAQGAAITDAAVAVAAPTKAEFDALVGKFNTLLARVRAGTGHGLIA